MFQDCKLSYKGRKIASKNSVVKWQNNKEKEKNLFTPVGFIFEIVFWYFKILNSIPQRKNIAINSVNKWQNKI